MEIGLASDRGLSALSQSRPAPNRVVYTMEAAIALICSRATDIGYFPSRTGDGVECDLAAAGGGSNCS